MKWNHFDDNLWPFVNTFSTSLSTLFYSYKSLDSLYTMHYFSVYNNDIKYCEYNARNWIFYTFDSMEISMWTENVKKYFSSFVCNKWKFVSWHMSKTFVWHDLMFYAWCFQCFLCWFGFFDVIWCDLIGFLREFLINVMENMQYVKNF